MRSASKEACVVRAQYSTPTDLIYDPAGFLVVADYGNVALHKVMLDGTTTTLIGANGPAVIDGPASVAALK
ncbi:MAG: hypothetical protein EXR79_14835 [Myxococcales bacterium]|nr:hypothetical protein [Myxococcales bacterium]